MRIPPQVAIVCLATVFCHLAYSQSSNDPADDLPNIVFLMADDQCCYSVGCYGNSEVQTPNLDQLAREGVRFDNHYDTTAICMASRANVMTGKLEYKTGCNFEHGPLLESIWKRSYPMRLREAGYYTGFAGKIGFEVAEKPGRKKTWLPEEDFDVWGGGPGQTSYETAKNNSMAKYAGEYPHSTLSYGAFGQDFIAKARESGKPFCLSISFKAPHKPATPDPRFDHVYRNRRFTKPANYGRENGEHFAIQSRLGRQYERFFSWNYADKYDEVMATYHQQCFAIDVAVGMIREALQTHGFSKNTVIIYTSDNGFLCGSHGYGSKVLPYEESSRVPLIMLDPREPASDTNEILGRDALTGNVDFAPTILSLAGLSVDEDVDGVDLMPSYRSVNAEAHPSLPLINVWGTAKVHSLAVVTKTHKYIYWPSTTDGMTPTEELYDTQGDPLELANLVERPEASSELAKMRALYDDVVVMWKQESVDFHDYSSHGNLFARKTVAGSE